MAENTEFAPMWARLIARYWQDPEFVAQMKLDPATVLTEMGITRVGQWDVADLEDKIDVVDAPPGAPEKPHWLEDGRLQLAIPGAPPQYTQVDVSEADLELVAGGEKTIDGMPKSVYDYRERHGEDPTDPEAPLSANEESAEGSAAVIAGAGEAAADTAWLGLLM